MLTNKEHIQSFQKGPWTVIFDHCGPELALFIVARSSTRRNLICVDVSIPTHVVYCQYLKILIFF